ncbi:Thioredoxin-like fold protein [Niveomyces insectorum RCEF 264]|uniref:Thioredoxin-like fold protein n=1 Tax=Niveomyces insectorum RCEF 264 TaxID=1081102 RepID=A0A167NHE3_9HYPO|nr:Thioredoxin-like fold protein [Niveomyces insectorum RCEF 264]
MSQTEAQEEFQRFVDRNNQGSKDDRHRHPEDRHEYKREAASGFDDLDEEDRHRAITIDAAMRMPTLDQAAAGTTGYGLNLPPASFDSGRATGVKGVIADARSYELARKASFMNRVRQARRSVFAFGHGHNHNQSHGSAAEHDKKSDLSSSDEEDQDDEESFLAQWRESRRRELEDETRAGAHIRTRRTSPSVRIFGRFDTVDALGYLDAIEKVGRETVVVVFCQVSSAVEAALVPLVGTYPTVHFVKVHYDDIEFDNAAVPSILAYRNQGDLFANMTGLIEMLPADGSDDDTVSSETLRKLLHARNIL